eukprot:3471156-Pyramimonas_sp.AAC.1
MLASMAKAHGDDRSSWPDDCKQLVDVWDKAVQQAEPKEDEVYQAPDYDNMSSFQLGQRMQGVTQKLDKAKERLREREAELEAALEARDAEQEI